MKHKCLMRNIVDFINDEFEMYDDVCSNGLFIDFEPSDKNTVVLGVYPSDFVIDKAIEFNAGLIITHHALWTKRDDVVITDNIYKKISKCIKHNIGIISLHKPIDKHKIFSHSMIIANVCGLSNIKFQDIDGVAFVTGDSLDNAYELDGRLSEFFGIESKKSIVKDDVGKVYILSGAGHRLFKDVIERGADTYITGTSDEPVWYLSNECKVNYLSFGHYKTEVCGMKAIGDFLQEKFGISCMFAEEDNPF